MKVLTWIGLASLAANAGLIVVIGTGAWRQSRSDAAIVPAAPVARSAAPAAVADAPPWTDLGAGDIATLRDRLRAEGFPPKAVTTILGAQIRERNAARRKAIEARVGELPFWKAGYDAKTQAELREIDRDEMRELRELLGPSFYSDGADRLARQFPDLAREKVDQLTMIRARYDEQRAEVYGSNRGGMFMAVDQEKIAALEKAMHAEFAAVLSPDEMENYDLRMSNAANQLRYNLGNFELSEAEFRTVYRLQAAFDEQYNMRSSMTPELQRARTDAQKLLNAELAAALGPTRYAEFERAKDYNYKQTTQVVARLGLPPETANALYGVQKDFEQRRTAFFSSGPVDAERANEFFATEQRQAQAKVHTILGGNQTALEAYNDYGGSWLKNMVRPRTPLVPKK